LSNGALSPDDAMWKTWDDLLVAYNLEDKVVVDGVGEIM